MRSCRIQISELGRTMMIRGFHFIEMIFLELRIKDYKSKRGRLRRDGNRCLRHKTWKKGEIEGVGGCWWGRETDRKRQEITECGGREKEREVREKIVVGWGSLAICEQCLKIPEVEREGRQEGGCRGSKQKSPVLQFPSSQALSCTLPKPLSWYINPSRLPNGELTLSGGRDNYCSEGKEIEQFKLSG